MQDGSEKLAAEIGEEIAKRGYILVFGPERDRNSLPTVAARAAYELNGSTLAIAYSSGKAGLPDCITHLVCTGSERGGPRESVFVMSCDALIAIGGGSGTATEMLIAYQNGNRPIVAIEGTGGWADKMIGNCFDERPGRTPVQGAGCAKEALDLVERLLNTKKINKPERND